MLTPLIRSIAPRLTAVPKAGSLRKRAALL